MVTTRWARAWAVGTIGVVLAMPVGPASADTTTYDDPVGDSTTVDISRVRVMHRDAITVRVRSAVPLTVGALYTFWFDIGRGPDYHIAIRPNSDYESQLGLVRRFGGHPSRFVECHGIRAGADIFSDAPVTMRIPRRCLADPRRVRVAVRFAAELTDDVDWAPEPRTFGPWVAR